MQVHFSGEHFVNHIQLYDVGALLWQAICKSPTINVMQVHYSGKHFVNHEQFYAVGALLWQALL